MHLVDPVPLHVEQARQAAGADPAPGFTAALGDARELPEQAGSQDAVLLFGPLYHLTGAAQRRQALAEARRVLRPGGRLLAMAVCRFASLPGGLYQGWLEDPDFRPVVDQDLLDGSTATLIPSAGRSSSPPPASIPQTAWPARSNGLVSPAWPSTGSRARTGRCARSGQIPGGASRSCSQHAQPRHSPR